MARNLLFAVILVLGVGVALFCHVAARPGEAFEVGIRNRTGADIEHAGVRAGAVDASMGFVVSGGNATYGLFRGPAPASADVRWTSADGRVHAVTVTAVRRRAAEVRRDDLLHDPPGRHRLRRSRSPPLTTTPVPGFLVASLVV